MANMTAVDAAFRLGLDYQKVYRLILSRKLPAERVGKRWMVAEKAVAAFEAERNGQPAEVS